jgi:protoheme IX farnesyltransferase
MQAAAAARAGSLRDYLALAKPRVTSLVIFTTAGGLWLAPGALSKLQIALTLLGTVLIVAAANALNMYLERDTDALMARTANRPLPAGRMEPSAALKFGLLLAAISVPLLTFAVGALPALLASVALVSYVLLYTPLKRRSATALLVGALPGAIPPLIGWTAATGHLDPPGVLLFALMFLWQVPHFLAITLFRKDEYARAGLVVLPNEPGGDETSRMNIVRYSVALLGVSLLFVPVRAAGWLYFWVAFVAGTAFFAHGLMGLRQGSGPRWARGLFLHSLLYLTVIFSVLMIDKVG